MLLFLLVEEAISVQESQITDEFRWGILQRKAQETRVLKAFDLFREHNIEPILIKGLAATQFYPPAKFRNSIDMDLAVSRSDFDAANVISRSVEANGLAIDVHRELRHLDTVDWDDLFNNSKLLQLEQGTIRVLRPEDHLRVLCVHWLTDGGSNKDRLWDIYYLIDNRSAGFDWDRFLKTVGFKRRRWLICTVGLAQRFLGLDLSDTPIETRTLPNWFVKTVEREWASETRLVPLESSLFDPSLLFKQFKKRFQANPIWATVNMNGSFDARTRFFYQIGSFFKRIPSSVSRISETIAGKRSD